MTGVDTMRTSHWRCVRNGTVHILAAPGRVNFRLRDSAHRQVPGPPIEDRVEPLQPVLRPSGPGQLVPLGREQQHLGIGTASLERHEQPLRLLHRAAPVVLGVDDQQRHVDLVGVGERRPPPLLIPVRADVGLGEEVTDVAGAGERVPDVDRPLADRRDEPLAVVARPARTS